MPLFAHRWVTTIEDVEKTRKHVQQMLEELEKPLDKRKDKLPITNDPATESSSSSSPAAKKSKISADESQQLVAFESSVEDDLDVNGLWCNTATEEAKQLIERESDHSDEDEDIPTILELKKRLRKKTEGLRTARLTYSGRDELDVERSVFISKMRYTYTSKLKPRCGNVTRGTDVKGSFPVLQLAAFEHVIPRYTKQRKRGAKDTMKKRRDINDFVPSTRKFWKINVEYEIPLSCNLTELCDILMAEVESHNDLAKLDKRVCTTAFCIGGKIYKDDRVERDVGTEMQLFMNRVMSAYKEVLSIPQYAEPPLLMSETRFCDMKIPLGEPFVFIHERENPQILLFTDMRFSSAPISEYPMTLFRRTVNLKKCECCGGNYARKLTLSSAHAPSTLPGAKTASRISTLMQVENYCRKVRSSSSTNIDVGSCDYGVQQKPVLYELLEKHPRTL